MMGSLADRLSIGPNTVVKKRVGYVEPKTGQMRDTTWIVANGIDLACFDRFEYYVAADRVTGCGFGPRFATERQAVEYHRVAAARREP